MIAKALPLVAGISALVASAVVALAAALFGLYSALRMAAGPAASVGGVFAIFAALLLVAGAVALLVARGRRRPRAAASRTVAPPRHDRNATPLQRLADVIRDRPLLAAGGAAAAGLIALRNPAVVLGLGRLAFLSLQGPPRRR